MRSQVNSNTLMNLLEKVKVLKDQRMRSLRRQPSPERSHEDKNEFQKLQESVIKVETGRKSTVRTALIHIGVFTPDVL